MKENLLHSDPKLTQIRIETMRALSEKIGVFLSEQDDKFLLNLYELYVHEFMRLERHKKKGLAIAGVRSYPTPGVGS